MGSRPFGLSLISLSIPMDRLMPRHVIAIAIGGALGALSRYGVNVVCARWLGDHFAFGTLVVNVVGCFLLGLLMPLGTADIPRWNAVTHSAMTVGFLGALTTFSTFGFETARFIENTQHSVAALNVSANLVLGMAAVYAGLLLGRWIVS